MNIKEWSKYAFGSILAGLTLVLVSTLVVYPAIDQIIGLAVVGNTAGTQWNSVKDAGIQPDGTLTGVLSGGLFGFNGATWDRLRSSTANGLQVDVTRISGTVTVVGNQTPADSLANPATAVITESLNSVLNGASAWDRLRSAFSDGQTGTGMLAAGNMLYNVPTNTFDRWKGIDGFGQITNTLPRAGQITISQTSAAGTLQTVTITGAANLRAVLYGFDAYCTAGTADMLIQKSTGPATLWQTTGGAVPLGPAVLSKEFSGAPLTSTSIGDNILVSVTGCSGGVGTSVLMVRGARTY